jgi:hypothetical protein
MFISGFIRWRVIASGRRKTVGQMADVPSVLADIEKVILHERHVE